jgi:hypothetical protein
MTTGSGSTWTGVNGWTVHFTSSTSGSVDDTSAAFQCNNTTNVVVNNLDTSYVPGGIQETGSTPCTTVQFNAPIIRFASNNSIFTGNGASWEIDDAKIIAGCPHDNTQLHVDFFQVTDGAAMRNAIFRRMIAIDADSCLVLGFPTGSPPVRLPVGVQAPFFSQQGAWQVTGYVDDGLGGGTYDGVAGNKLTVTAVTHALVSNVTSALLDINGVPHVTAFPTGGSQGAVTGVYTISGGAQTVAPTTIHTYYTTSMQIDGLIYVGCATNGLWFSSFVDGSIKHATYFHANTSGIGAAACATTGPTTLFSSPTRNGTGLPYDGANTLTDSYFSGSQSTMPASFTTARNYYANGANGTTDPACGVTCDFVNTTPKATLEAYAWSGKTVAQQVAEIVAVLTPSGTVGSNTNQAGTIIGALTTSGLWNDGSGIAP